MLLSSFWEFVVVVSALSLAIDSSEAALCPTPARVSNNAAITPSTRRSFPSSLQMSSSRPDSDTFLSLASTAEGDMSLHFGKCRISASSIFYRSTLSAAFVNLRPIVPGHVLVVSKRIVATLDELHDDEYVDLWKSVRIVQRTLGQYYHASAFNVAVQDGTAAGQSVPHVHVHILPRVVGDLERNDEIYDELETWAPREELKVHKPRLDVPKDKDRNDRTVAQMEEEAAIYRDLLQC